MKYLISLSLKYLRRQKLRSTLTFFSIVLSVFILNTCSVYFSSIITSSRNTIIQTEGSWELECSNIIEQSKDIKKIQYHTSVSNFFYRSQESLQMFTITSNPVPDDPIEYFNISFDDKTSVRCQNLYQYSQTGDPQLINHENISDIQLSENEPEPGSAYMPEFLKKYGYKAGDNISITFTPVKADIDKNSDVAGQIISDYRKDNTSGKPLTNQSLWLSLLRKHDINDIQLTEKSEGIPFSCAYHIAGFIKSDTAYLNTSFCFQTTVGSDNIVSGIARLNPDISDKYVPYSMSYARIKDSINFNTGAEKLISDLGYPENSIFELFPDECVHSDLLAAELKPAYALAQYAIDIVFFLFFLAIAWVISRFVIDNAFEISVCERSAQFGLLRTLGASKSQIKALVFTEAIVYCLTAVPLGVACAVLSCRSVFSSLRKSGITTCEFNINPVFTLIGILLSVTAIFFSAYSSAIWASRKLSPSEALSFGKPDRKTGKRKIKENKGKSRINKKSGVFIFSYTLKNILRTKRRFLISFIALASSVLLFTSLALTGLNLYLSDNLISELSLTGDFQIYSNSLSLADDAEEQFENNELFSDFSSVISYCTSISDNDSQVVKSFFPNDISNGHNIYIRTIDKRNYDKYILPLTSVTYKEFTDTKSALFYSGHSVSQDYKKCILKPSADFGYNTDPSIYIGENNSVSVSGLVTNDNNQNLCIEYLLISRDNFDPQMVTNAQSISDISITVNASSFVNYDKASDYLNQFLKKEIYYYYTDTFYLHTGLEYFIRAVVKIALVFILSLWLTGIISMANSINTSVLNRQKELIMMRSIGMSKRQLYSTVIFESILYSSLSTVIGTAAGIAVLLLEIKCYNTQIKSVFITSAVVFIIISIVFNILVSVLSVFPAVHSISQKLKTE
ncbi:MAG: FtsX-like permease family protein [Oscillospiraceae bacterium]|nr:FtsX-like permease family protein [Oscillospiraceae bacterium]